MAATPAKPPEKVRRPRLLRLATIGRAIRWSITVIDRDHWAGVDGLHDLPRSGRPPRLNAVHLAELARLVVEHRDKTGLAVPTANSIHWPEGRDPEG